MKSYPKVMILGRQNVGKSTLFNTLTHTTLSITKNTPGVTRDVLEKLVESSDYKSPFVLCDTPGLDIEDENDLTRSILDVSFAHLRKANLILHILDKKDLRPYDSKLIEMLRKDEALRKIPVITLVNKSDSPEDDYDLEEFYRLGLAEVIPISALGRKNLGLLREKINFFLPNSVDEDAGEGVLFRLAILGKPNSGKSSLLNSILGFDRSVVSEISGTTRDSVNSYFKYNDRILELIDTAGIRRQSKTSESLEFYSFKRALKAIESADIVVLLVDATKGFGDFDKKLFSLLERKGKAFLVAFSKWDLIEDKDSNTQKKFFEKAISRLPILNERPMLTISATAKQRVTKVLDEAIQLYERSQRKIPTAKLNESLKKWTNQGKIGGSMKKKPKILYATQTALVPCRILFFVNDTSLFTPNLLSYYRKQLVETYDLVGIPIEIETRSDRR